MTRRAYIGLGGNLEDPAARLRWALERLAGLGRIVMVSPFYRSVPMGPGDQPDFCNAVCCLDTELAPAELMPALLGIERDAGRVRDRKWGPRTLDLDLLHVEGERSDDERLRLPHPGIAERNFVLVPLADIAPDLVVPGIGAVAERARAIGRDGLWAWSARG
ncbi:2-amino-4-hydroxy-6-hydroxymethyldihydropteridine diphosphokinase [Solimonas marina]|uniref:2-amino-4-hydroxy-6-hydroxymethyldihydropteridine pyrophosphokinase n=1 Tax=Solimonas marina TaxID=2714601 RepID=A0A969WC24_9GAMM|nr:2-amino-4-hydroxy-6-hydroxymethyldihydropteridine diphosphokinase [Solimonas marina]